MGNVNTAEELRLDFTSVHPDSGGVGIVARGVSEGLASLGIRHVCVVSRMNEKAWIDCFVASPRRTVKSVDVVLGAASRWQLKLRKVMPSKLSRTRIVGVVRNLRMKSTESEFDGSTVWLPFHRVPLAATRGIVTVHDLRVFQSEHWSPMDQRIIKRNVEQSKAVVCSWPHPAQQLVDIFPEAAEKTFIVPLPVLHLGEIIKRTRPAVDKIRLLLPGFVTPHKNHEIVIRALVGLPGATLVCTGTEEVNHADRMRQLATSLGVADRIIWRGFVSRDELEAEYKLADLLIMPSRWEAASGPVFEAIARQLPFIASSIPPISSQIEELGLDIPLFSPDEPEEVVDCVLEAVRNYDERVEQLKHPSEIVRNRTWDDCASDYARIFRWVAGEAEKPLDLVEGTSE